MKLKQTTILAALAGLLLAGSALSAQAQTVLEYWTWNNEGDCASNDVSGGFGLSGGFRSYSVGDAPNCCQSVTGANAAFALCCPALRAPQLSLPPLFFLFHLFLSPPSYNLFTL